MEPSKIMIAHIATEVVIIGGISFYFHKKITELNTKISELEKKIENLPGGNDDEKFKQQTMQHIRNLYENIKQFSNREEKANIGEKSNIGEKVNIKMSSQTHSSHIHHSSSDPKPDIKQNHMMFVSSVIPSLSLNYKTNPTTEKAKIEVINEEELYETKESSNEELNDELEEELRDLSTNNSNDNIDELKDESDNINISNSLEFIPSKSKKIIKKKRT